MKSVRAVERAIDVLMCFGRDGPTLSVTDLQRALKLSRPTLYRLLHTLEGKGLIRSFGEPRRFELDYPVVGLANAWLAQVDVAKTGQQILKELWEATDETVALFVPVAGGKKVCVQELRSRKALVFARGAGFAEPMTVGSSGKAILAYVEEAELGRILAQPGDGKLRDGLCAELAGIRRDGYSISTGEIIDGAVAIAAPVFDHGGAVTGSVCLFGPEARLTGPYRERCLHEVREAAVRISRALGYRAPLEGRDAAE